MELFGYTIIKTNKLDNLKNRDRRYRQLLELFSWMGEFDVVVEMRKGFFEQIETGSYHISYDAIRLKMREIANKRLTNDNT